MDLNLFLLEKQEHIMLQRIDNSTPTIMKQSFNVKNIRDNLSVIVVCEDYNTISRGYNSNEDYNTISRGYNSNIPQDELNKIIEDGRCLRKEFESELHTEEEIIREEIKREKERRSEERREEEYVEEWPHLPNYENPDNSEPLGLDDYDDLPYDINRELESGELKKLTDLLKNLNNKDDRYNYRYSAYDSTPYEINRELERLNNIHFMTEYENLYPDTYSNYHLKLLDDRLGTIKHKLIRLNQGSLLGCFIRNYYKNKEKERKIYLFLDNIEKYAQSHGINRIEIIANVYVHELFHAYYSKNITKRMFFITNSITEIEEAMAEFGMLCFIQKVFPNYLQNALNCVREKLTTPDLRCYGLGAHLYDILITHNLGNTLFDGKILEKYADIQLSIRNSKHSVYLIKHLIRATPFDYIECIANIENLFNRYIKLRQNQSTAYYSFNNKTFGTNINVARAAIDYYIRYVDPTFLDIKTHFKKTYGPNHRCFEDINTINKPQDYKIEDPVTLKDGTNIVLKRSWGSDLNGGTLTLIKEFDKLYRMGKIDQHILYLG